MAIEDGRSSLGRDSGHMMRNVVGWSCFSVLGGRKLPVQVKQTWSVGKDDQSLGLPTLTSTHWTAQPSRGVTREKFRLHPTALPEYLCHADSVGLHPVSTVPKETGALGTYNEGLSGCPSNDTVEPG